MQKFVAFIVLTALACWGHCHCESSRESNSSHDSDINEEIEEFEVVDLQNRSIDSRIVGGALARPGQFPYQVTLLNNNFPFCGGSLVSVRHILTAAHCVFGMPVNQLSVRVGSIDLNSGGQVVRIEDVKVHPQYKFPLYDSAIVKLAKEVLVSDTIRPISPSQASIKEGAKVVVSGFGATKTGGKMSNQLRYVTLTAMSEARCRDSILCLSHPRGRGICQGDSGGPAVFGNYLVGSMSFTIGGCGLKGHDGFARISHIYPWIIQNLR